MTVNHEEKAKKVAKKQSFKILISIYSNKSSNNV